METDALGPSAMTIAIRGIIAAAIVFGVYALIKPTAFRSQTAILSVITD